MFTTLFVYVSVQQRHGEAFISFGSSFIHSSSRTFLKPVYNNIILLAQYSKQIILWYILIYLISEWVPKANFDLFEIQKEGSPVLGFEPWTSWLDGEHANSWAKVWSHTGLCSVLHSKMLHYLMQVVCRDWILLAGLLKSYSNKTIYTISWARSCFKFRSTIMWPLLLGALSGIYNPSSTWIIFLFDQPGIFIHPLKQELKSNNLKYLYI